jgi:hypothetical protein
LCIFSIRNITKKIIIDDDEEDLLYLYAEVLGLKYSIITTTNGKRIY